MINQPNNQTTKRTLALAQANKHTHTHHKQAHQRKTHNPYLHALACLCLLFVVLLCIWAVRCHYRCFSCAVHTVCCQLVCSFVRWSSVYCVWQLGSDAGVGAMVDANAVSLGLIPMRVMCVLQLKMLLLVPPLVTCWLCGGPTACRTYYNVFVAALVVRVACAIAIRIENGLSTYHIGMILSRYLAS